MIIGVITFGQNVDGFHDKINNRSESCAEHFDTLPQCERYEDQWYKDKYALIWMGYEVQIHCNPSEAGVERRDWRS